MKDDDDLTSAYLLGAYDASHEWRDAAEFEARVSRKLAIPVVGDMPPCPYGYANLCICEGEGIWLGCEGSRLKWARLKVEEEMDDCK